MRNFICLMWMYLRRNVINTVVVLNGPSHKMHEHYISLTYIIPSLHVQTLVSNCVYRDTEKTKHKLLLNANCN